MKILTQRVLFTLLIITSSSLASDVMACTCAPRPSPYKQFRNARAVFAGTSLGSKDVEGTEVVGQKKFKVVERIFTFKINESFKGLSKKTQVEINAGRTDSSCFGGFSTGKAYLIYAFGESEDTLYAGACTRTNDLSDAADDVHYIRALLKGVPESRIYGSVMRAETTSVDGVADYLVTPVAGIKVLIEGEGKSYEAVTDKDGLYRLADVPDGRYKARPILPKQYRAYFPIEEEFFLGPQEQLTFYTQIEPGPTANINFRIGWGNNLSGTVRDSEGNPIVRHKASIFLDRDSSPLLIQRDHFDYHPEGRFDFVGLTPGRYLLSVDIRAPFTDPKRPTCFYYPNTDARDQATKIEIGKNDPLEDRDIRLPPGYVVRQIDGVLVLPNGVPVEDGWVVLAASKDSTDNGDDKYNWTSTDQLGRFSLQAFVGAEYWLHAKSRSAKAEPIKVKVERVNEQLKIVIPFGKQNEP